MIALLVMTDGRAELLAQTLAAFDQMVDTAPVTRRLIHDDSGDPSYRTWLAAQFPTYDVFGPSWRRGYGAAMANAWARVAADVTETYLLHLEDDFEFTRPTDLLAPVAVLQGHDYLAQMSFRRQPWHGEPDPGGFIAADPDAYTVVRALGQTWLENRRTFTCNPNLHRRELCSVGWPQRRYSEGLFAFELRRNGLPWGVPADDVRFGIWGDPDTSEGWVRHTGVTRNGWGY